MAGSWRHGLGSSGDERSRRARVDGVADGAQLSHAGGYPMSQNTNSGFNAPRFSVGTADPIEPSFVIATSLKKPLFRPALILDGRKVPLFRSNTSAANGVGHVV
jgi:hypothetical protein